MSTAFPCERGRSRSPQRGSGLAGCTPVCMGGDGSWGSPWLGTGTQYPWEAKYSVTISNCELLLAWSVTGVGKTPSNSNSIPLLTGVCSGEN